MNLGFKSLPPLSISTFFFEILVRPYQTGKLLPTPQRLCLLPPREVCLALEKDPRKRKNGRVFIQKSPGFHFSHAFYMVFGRCGHDPKSKRTAKGNRSPEDSSIEDSIQNPLKPLVKDSVAALKIPKNIKQNMNSHLLDSWILFFQAANARKKKIKIHKQKLKPIVLATKTNKHYSNELFRKSSQLLKENTQPSLTSSVREDGGSCLLVRQVVW